MLVNFIEFPFTRTQLIHSWETVVKWISVVNQLSNSMWNTNILKLQVLFYTCRIFFSSFFLHTKATVFIPTVQILYIYESEFFFLHQQFSCLDIALYTDGHIFHSQWLKILLTENTVLSLYSCLENPMNREDWGGYSSWGHRVNITEWVNMHILMQYSAIANFKFLTMFEQKAQYFHFY